VWDRVAPDELVDRVATDPKHTPNLDDVEHVIRRLFVIRRTHGLRCHELWLVSESS
jgi:hypothetical protein